MRAPDDGELESDRLLSENKTPAMDFEPKFKYTPKDKPTLP